MEQLQQSKKIEEYPLILKASHIAEIMQVSEPTAYAIMDRKDFPLMKYGDRLVEIAREHTQLAKEAITQKHCTDAEIIEARIIQLRMERDGILELFEDENE